MKTVGYIMYLYIYEIFLPMDDLLINNYIQEEQEREEYQDNYFIYQEWLYSSILINNNKNI